jgi:hypothetical protein
LFVAGAVAAWVLHANAAGALSYSPVSGLDVDFENISDSSGLYGQPSASGNSLNFFLSNAFMADTDGGTPEGPNTSDTVNFTIQGQTSGSLITGIETISLDENGDFSLLALPGAFSQVTSNGDIGVIIQQVNGVAVTVPQVSLNFTITYTPNVGAGSTFGNSYSIFSAGAPVLDNGSWDGSISIDVNQILLNNGFDPSARATRVQITVENELIAQVFGSGSAGIDKDFFGSAADMTVQVNNQVPEPGTLLLVGVGLLGLARSGRGRR